MPKIKITTRMTSKWKIITKKVWNTNSNPTKFKKSTIYTIRYKMFRINKKPRII